MTTARQVKRLLTPLLQRHEDLALNGHWLILKPIRHLLRGIVLERTGDAGRFRPRWAVAPLCEPRQSFPVTWGEILYRGRLWKWDDPSLQEELFQAIEQRALPALQSIATLDNFVTFASSRERFSISYFDGYLLIKVGVDIARGELNAARAACSELATGKTKWSMPSLREDFVRVTRTLCPLLAANDQSAMARLLHEWEAYTVKQLKLEDLWEPTPFPLEETPPTR